MLSHKHTVPDTHAPGRQHAQPSSFVGPISGRWYPTNDRNICRPAHFCPCLCRLALVLGVQPLSCMQPQDLFSTPGSAIILLNGQVLGTHRCPQWLVRQLRRARRAGLLPVFVSVFLQHDTVQIACDGGRLCRPLIVCDDGVPRLTQQHVEV